VSGAERAKKPLHAPVYFCNPHSPLRSLSATSRSALRYAPSFFCNARSPLHHPIFGSLRSALRGAPTIKFRISITNSRQINHASLHFNVLLRCIEYAERSIVAMKVSVRPSCLSVKRVDCDKTEEKYIKIFIPYERSFSLVFRKKELLVG